MIFEEQFPSLQKEEFELEECVITGRVKVDKNKVIEAIQKHTIDKQRVKEALKNHLDGYSDDGQLREAWQDLLREISLPEEVVEE